MLFKYVDNAKFEQCLVFQGNELIEREIKSLGFEVYTIPSSLKKKFSIKSFIQFYSFVKSHKIDIIHTHFLKPYSISGIVNIFLRKKMIYNYHGLFIENLYNSKSEKFIYRNIHRIINYLNVVDLALVPSNTGKQMLLNETSLFKFIKVYYNGYDSIVDKQPSSEIVSIFSHLKKAFHIVGIIARIDIQKRIDIALEIAKEITRVRNDVYFVILGDGDLEGEMAKKIESMNLNQNVKMFGYVPNAKLYIKYFDFTFLFTSDWEGLPLSVWEAMAAKVTIVFY